MLRNGVRNIIVNINQIIIDGKNGINLTHGNGVFLDVFRVKILCNIISITKYNNHTQQLKIIKKLIK